MQDWEEQDSEDIYDNFQRVALESIDLEEYSQRGYYRVLAYRSHSTYRHTG